MIRKSEIPFIKYPSIMTEHEHQQWCFSGFGKDGEKMNKKRLWIVITLVVIAIVTVPATACSCKVTGIGHIKGLFGLTFASFGGNGMPMKDGTIRGEWNHVDHVTGAHFHGDVTWLTCYDKDPYEGPDVPGAPYNYAEFGGLGTGTLNGVDGCNFGVKAYDINEGGIHKDGYHIRVTCPDGSTLHNDATSDACDPLGANPIGCLAGGNFQIHASNKGHPY